MSQRSQTTVDPYKEDAGWLYSPAQRKPRRLLSSERTSESNTSPDNIREDGYGFSGRVHKHNWKYLGTRTVLATMNLADNPEAGEPSSFSRSGIWSAVAARSCFSRGQEVSSVEQLLA